MKKFGITIAIFLIASSQVWGSNSSPILAKYKYDPSGCNDIHSSKMQNQEFKKACQECLIDDNAYCDQYLSEDKKLFFTGPASFFTWYSGQKQAIYDEVEKEFGDVKGRQKNIQLTVAQFKKLYNAMKSFHEAYTASGNQYCKDMGMSHLKEAGYIDGNQEIKFVNRLGTYSKVKDMITVTQANQFLEAYKRAYVNAISNNTTDYDNEKSTKSKNPNLFEKLGVLMPKSVAPRMRGKCSKDYLKKHESDHCDENKSIELYPEDLYEGAVVNGKRSVCVNGLKKKQITIDNFDRMFSHDPITGKSNISIN